MATSPLLLLLQGQGSHHVGLPVTHGWCQPVLRLGWYNLDKEYSWMASRLAIPQLLNETNVLRDPQRAAERFRSVVMKPEVYYASMLRGRAYDDNDEEPFEQYLDRLHHMPCPMGNNGSAP